MTATLADAYSETGDAWARGPERVYQALAEAMVDCSPVDLSGRTVLDVGAGTGAAGRAALGAGAAGVIAVDVAPGMLAHRREERPPGLVGDACRLPVRSASFDGALAAFSLNHLPEPDRGLAEMVRACRPGSPVLAAAYAEDDTHPVKAAVERALAARGWASPAWYTELRSTVTPLLATPEGCRRALERAGLVGDVRAVRVAFPDLGAAELVEWRLGMAQHAPFVATLGSEARAELAASVAGELGADVEALVRSTLVITTTAP